MSTSLTIHLKRASKVYHEGDTVAGVVLVESAAGDVRHEGLTLLLEGCVSLQPGARAQGLLDAFAATMRPIPLVSATLELSPAGSLPAGATPIPFELPLRCRAASAAGTPRLLETYHGVFVSVMYALKATLRRPLFSKPLHASCQLFVQYPLQEPAPAKPVRCVITPATVRAGGGAGGAPGPRGAGAGQAMPDFQIYAELETTVCALDKPITGKLRVESCSASIKSVELQLVRVETCGAAEAQQRDATEIQNIQVCEGDVARGRDLTLHMVLPRLFTCPTTTTNNFKIEFELNIAVIFEDDYLVTENFPILLLRSR